MPVSDGAFILLYLLLLFSVVSSFTSSVTSVCVVCFNSHESDQIWPSVRTVICDGADANVSSDGADANQAQHQLQLSTASIPNQNTFSA